LPQGGLDGEDIIKGGGRELEEESGAKSFIIKGAYKDLYKYNYQHEAGTYNSLDHNRHAGYRGQKQSLLIAQFQGSDDEFRLNYWDHRSWRWVKEADFIKNIHPLRQKSGKIYLQKLRELKHAA